MTNERNTEERIPVSLAGIGVEAAPLQNDPSHEVVTSLADSTKQGLEPSTNAHSERDYRDVVVEGAHGPDSQEEHALEKIDDDKNDAGNINLGPDANDRPYSLFTHNEKRIIIFCAGLSQFFSPVSGQIYFPSLEAISKDLDVSMSLVNLTITTYLIMQGLAPSFVGGFSDSSGRRPAYFACCIIYAAANIGLGIQNNYAALMVLRCLQSAGSSGTVALGNAVVSDLVTSQERGVYISYMPIASQAGPAIGPIIGGLLGQYLGWHSVFRFLLICLGVVFVPCALFLVETGRKIVGDGSVPPPKWRRCLINKNMEKRFIAEGRMTSYDKRDELARNRKARFPNPLQAVKIVFTKEAGYVLAYIGLLCCAYYATVALIPSQFGSVYGFNQIQIALCYLPLGCGSLLAGLVRGRIIDARFKAHAERLGYPPKHNRELDLSDFPIERARLEVVFPTVTLGTACFIGFGWMIEYKVNLSGPLVLLFAIGFCVSAAINTVAVLLVDIYPGRAGSASAANNLVRCWLGAGATSGVQPLINKIGIGWTTTFFGHLVVVASPILWYIIKNGPNWHQATKERKARQEAERVAKADVGGENGRQ